MDQKEIENILEHIDKFPEFQDRDALLYLFQEEMKNIICCNLRLSEIQTTLYLYRNDENIIGNFARIFNSIIKESDDIALPYDKDYDYNIFLKIIGKQDDKDMIYWLAANNIRFLHTLNKSDRHEYLLMTLSSFTYYDRQIDIDDDIYYVHSDYNYARIILNKVGATCKIYDNIGRSVSYKISDSEHFYNLVKETLLNTIKEIDKTKDEQVR